MVQGPRLMDRDEVRKVRDWLGVSRRDFARCVGCDMRTVARWEDTDHAPAGTSLAVLHAFREAMSLPNEKDVAQTIRRSIPFGGLSYLVVSLLNQVVES